MIRSQLKIPRGKVVAVDTETTGLNVWCGDRIFAVSLCNEAGTTGYCEWPVNPLTREVEPDPTDVYRLRDWSADSRVRKVLHNAKFDLPMFQHGLGFPEEQTIEAHPASGRRSRFRSKGEKRPSGGETFADRTGKYGETLEPWSRSTSRRCRDGLRPEANLKTHQSSRSRTVVERAPRRNPRSAGCLRMLPSLRRTALSADPSNVHLPRAAWWIRLAT